MLRFNFSEFIPSSHIFSAGFKTLATCLCCVFLMASLPATPATAARVKDIARIKGVRDNQLIGYGLVVGLNGSGDSDKSQFSNQSLFSMMENLGVSVDQSKLKVNNVAAVMVTAKLPPFAQSGNTIDVMVSSIGDASSLAGGTLLMTPLQAADNNVYAVAQGPVVVGALSYGGKSAKVQKNHPTVGRIPEGGIVEMDAPFDLPENGTLAYQLKRADFTTANRMAKSICKRFGKDAAKPQNSRTVLVKTPQKYQGQVVAFIADLEMLEVQPDAIARIVVNERTGTIVMGEEVRISTVAISHGNLSLIIGETAMISQPEPGSLGTTAPPIPQTQISVSEEQGNMVVMDMGTTIADVASALNAIGASPRDLIAILQAIKEAGALHADLTVI